ncbi:hypothetical protein CSUI_010722, partial [Cystoisospora suis]
MCVPIEDVLKLLANHPVETHPLVFHARITVHCLASSFSPLLAFSKFVVVSFSSLSSLCSSIPHSQLEYLSMLGNCLAMGIGLLEGCPQESVAVWSLWLQEAIQYVVAVALKYIAYPHILHKALKFFLRFLKKAYSCFTEAAAWSFIERYKSLIEQM